MSEQLGLFVTSVECAQVLKELLAYSTELVSDGSWTLSPETISDLVYLSPSQTFQCLLELMNSGLAEEVTPGRFRISEKGSFEAKAYKIAESYVVLEPAKPSPARRPDITHVRSATMNYIARGSEYGASKYARGDYLTPTMSLRDDFLRLRENLRAAVSHLMHVLDAMEMHQAIDLNLSSETAMKSAAYAMDVDTTDGDPSKLPHICEAAARLNMAITQAVNAGLLPADPGRPWEEKK